MKPDSRPARIVAGYGAIVCALPYLALKIVWLSGGDLGVADARMMHDPSMVALNAITAGMDVVGIAMALTFTHRWGLKVPAWLVLPPMWVATGLLARFVLAVPIATIVGTLGAGPTLRDTGGPVQPWVYLVVYTEFAGLGIGLMLAFFLYARRRWTFIVAPMPRVGGPSVTRRVQVPLANTAALLALAVAGLQLAWTFGATVGIAAEQVARRTIVSSAVNLIDAAMTMAAAVGVLTIVRDSDRRFPFARAVALAWIGSGSLFGWGLWHLINVLGNTPLLRERAGTMGLVNFVALVQLITGLVIGIIMLIALAERDATISAAHHHHGHGDAKTRGIGSGFAGLI